MLQVLFSGFSTALLAVLALLASGCGGAAVPAPVESISVGELSSDPEVVRPEYHLVQPGETLIEIALNYGLDHNDIALWNTLSNPDHIDVGQKLLLKEPENAPIVSAIASQKLGGGDPAASTLADPASLERQIVPEKRVIGGDQAMVAQVQPVASIVKNGPRALSHPYSEAKLVELKSVKSAGIGEPDELAYAPERTVAVPPPGTVKDKFGNSWSWPVGGSVQVLDQFSEQLRGMILGGIDGSPVFASADGEVLYVGSGMKGYGKLVVIRHGNDYVSAYGNNQEIFVQAQDKVKRGQVISRMGDTGANRVQLQFEIRKGGKPLNPLQFMPELP